MYTNNYQELLTILENLKQEECSRFLIIAKDAEPLDMLYIQPLVRTYENKEITFLSLRNIIISEQFRNQGICSKILDILESKKYPIFIDDIINDEFDKLLEKRGYIKFYYTKNGENLLSRILI